MALSSQKEKSEISENIGNRVQATVPGRPGPKGCRPTQLAFF